MWDVKHFVGGTTREALKFLDNEIREWFREAKVKQIIQVTESFGQAPGSGKMDNAIFVSIWYRADDEA